MPTRRASLRRSGARSMMSTWALAIVTERSVTLSDGVAPADLLRTGDEVQALLGVAGDPVEDESQQAARVRLILMPSHVVEHPLHHLQLVQREQRHPLGERGGAFVQLVVRHAFVDHPG